MTDHLEKPDSGASYVRKAEEKHDYKDAGLCIAKCAEETEGCKGYKLSIVFGCCIYLSSDAGRCLRPERRGYEAKR